MKKMMMFLAAMTLIAFAYASTDVFARGMHREAGLMMGKDVRNLEGEELGTVNGFVKDSEGRISFAIVSHGGMLGFGAKHVAIPYSALTYDEEEQLYTCDLTRDQFASAPEFEHEDQLSDRSFAEEIYRHFGQRPYWTEESTGSEESEGTESPRDGEILY
jgi:sporulation protein YlmC with PRC-barrel domain